MYDVEFTKHAEKQFNKLSRDVQLRTINVLERIKIRPFHFIKRKEGSQYFIMRVGEHRAILDVKIESAKIIIMELGHRKNIYD